MKSGAIILWALLTSALLPVSVCGAKPGDTIFGDFGNYSNLPPERKAALREDAALAKAAYNDGTIPPGYRAATRAEYNQYIGLTSQKNIQYDPNTGYFQTIGLPETGLVDSIIDSVLGGGDSNNGLAGRILINEKNGSFVLAFRGTEGSLKDVSTDLFQGAGGVPEQYKEATEMLENLVSKTATEQIPIKVVGHSLGGAIATYSTLECGDVNRVTTTTFNAAGLYPTNINQAHLSTAAPKITNIRVDEDAVSNSTGLLIGNVYNLDSGNMVNNAITDGSGEGARAGGLIGSAGGAIGGTIAGKVMVHSMDTVIKLMNDDASRSQTEISNDMEDVVSDSRVPDENNPAKDDSTAIPGSGNDGEVCYPGENGSASGDSTVMPGSGDDDGGMCYAPQDGSASETDVTQYPSNNQESWDSPNPQTENSISPKLPSLGDLDELADRFALVGPNIPHRRVLWVFSGEPWDDIVMEGVNSIKSLFDDFNFSDIGHKLSERSGFSGLKDAFSTITGIGN